MMYAVVLLSIIMSLTIAAPVTDDDAHAKIISYTNTNDGSGNYNFSYETSNGLKRSETGELVNAGQPDEHIVVRGEFSYIDSDGQLQTVQYVADENGYNIVIEEMTNKVQYGLPYAAVATLLG